MEAVGGAGTVKAGASPRPAGHVPRQWATESRGQLPGGAGQPSSSRSDTVNPPSWR